MKILTINNKNEQKFLRRKTANFDFTTRSKKEINELIKQMKEIMLAAPGVGLSANQVGMNLRFFIVQLPPENISSNQRSNQHKSALYTIFNPEITKYSKETIKIEEGCLSVPGVYGLVERPEKIILIGYDKNGKKLKIKAWGLLARVFQHEIDHLNGILFIDRCKKVYAIEKSEILNPKS